MNNVIKSIALKKFKGIADREIKFSELTPNKLCVIVGSNGSGKSSFAHAFTYLNKEKFIPEGADVFKINGVSYKNDAFLEIKSIFENCDVNLVADSKKNAIKDYYTFTVINSRLKAKVQHVGPNIKIPKLSVDEVEICSILEKTSVTYSPNEGKQVFGKTYQKLFNNIDWFYKNEECVNQLLDKFYDFSESVRLKKLVDEFLSSLDCYIIKKSKDFILSIIDLKQLSSKLIENKKFVEVYSFLCGKHSYENCFEALFDAIQVIFYKIDKTNLRAFVEYKRNESFIAQTMSLVDVLNTTNREVLCKKNKTLVLSLPDPSTISNGERDLLCLLASAYSVLNSRNRKQQAIIVFDEIFDYLDGGNMLEFQYLIDYLIQTSKNNNAYTYFLAFTHLDPVYFGHFILKNIDIEYFDDYSDVIDNKILIDYIENRKISSIEDLVAKYFFHFEPNSFVFGSKENISNSFELNFINEYPTQEKFYRHLEECVNKYINDQKYPFIELCIWIRIQCEKYAYYNIDDVYKGEFLSIHTTKMKLEFASNKIILPEIFNLFKFVYNDAEHLNEKSFIVHRKNLHLKFTSKSVKNLVRLLKELMTGVGL